MIRALLISAALLASMTILPNGAAQSPDMSPTLILESLPSDNPDYRRMVRVEYLSADSVTVAYKAYNRTEFQQIPSNLSQDAINNCARGAASTLAQLRAFEQAEAARADAGQPPVPARFCIKNVPQWEARNKDIYLDPVFNGLPYAASLNNG